MIDKVGKRGEYKSAIEWIGVASTQQGAVLKGSRDFCPFAPSSSNERKRMIQFEEELGFPLAKKTAIAVRFVQRIGRLRGV
jgi:hypothetical protein